jgi:glycosyltransferase involved in cell wall biosynthesis
MKLLLYSHFFAPSVGGVETIVRSLATGLAERRTSNGEREFDVTLITSTPAAGFRDDTLNFAVVRQPGLSYLWKLVRDTDVLHVAGAAIAPMLLGVLSTKPVVVEHHGYQAICPTGVLLQQPAELICPGQFRNRQLGDCYRCLKHEGSGISAIRRLILQFLRLQLCSRATLNIAISEHVLQRLGLPHSTVMLYGILPAPIENANSYKLPAPGENLQFGFLGRLVPEKGCLLLVEAANILRQTTRSFGVSLIGDGPERTRIEQAITQHDLKDFVSIRGSLQGRNLQLALAPIHALIMPSIYEEPAGLSAMENMMQGRPVIASCYGGLREIVGDAGLTFDPTHPPSLAACMERIIRNPSLLQALRQKGKDRADRLFGHQSMIEKHAQTYRRLVLEETP